MTNPSGTVTFLFTDIEGSTRHLERLGDDAYAKMLGTHHELLRDAIAANRGRVVDVQGDSFFAAFGRPSDAIACALDAQRALHTHAWPDARVRVRMGLHTGEATSTETGYIGLAVHHAERVKSAAHGGQVLLSESTRTLVEGTTPDGAELADLGLHRLKDLTRAVRLYELRHPDLPAEHPQPRSLNARRHNLPVQPTPFLGRIEEIDRVRKLVDDPDVRLVTLTGPGGIGKTRLALQVAAESVERFGDGVWFVPLAPVSDAQRVPAAVAEALGVREATETSPVDVLLEEIASKRLLLILDNFEHVLDAATFVARALAVAPDVVVVATSRQPLHISAEYTYAVPQMEVAAAGESLQMLAQADAVRLFAERARSYDANFGLDATTGPIVSEICRRLDGLPLAIELAAARVRHLGAQGLLDRLTESLTVLGAGPGDAPDRHRTLDATIAWSYDLLSPREQELLRALSVFAGGCDLDAADGVSSATLEELTALTDRSLLRTDEESDETRFELLETVRVFVAARLEETGEASEVKRRHAGYFSSFADRSRKEIRGPDGVRWLNRLSADHDNFRAAMDYLWDTGDDPAAARLACALTEFWRIRGHFEEGRRRLERALETNRDRTPERAWTLVSLVRIERRPDAWAAPKRHWPKAEEALEIAVETGDRACQAYALVELSADTKGAVESFIAGFTSATSDQVDTIGTKREKGNRKPKKRVRSRERLEAALAVAVEVGDDALASEIRSNPLIAKGLLGFFRSIAGRQAAVAVELESARQRGDAVGVSNLLSRQRLTLSPEREAGLREAIEVARSVGDVRGAVLSLVQLADIAQQRHDFKEAMSLQREALAIAGETQDVESEARVLEGVLMASARVGDIESLDRAARRIEEFAAQDIGAAKLHRFVSPLYRLGARVTQLAGLRALLCGIAWVCVVLGLRPGRARDVSLAVIAWVLIFALWKRIEDIGKWERLRNPSIGIGTVTAVVFAVGIWRQSVVLPSVLLFGFALYRARRTKRNPAARGLLVLVAVVGLIASALASFSDATAIAKIPPFAALAFAIVVGWGYRRATLRWTVAQIGAVLVRLWIAVLAMHLLARWRTDGAFDFGFWGDLAVPATVAGLVVFGLALATTARLAPGGLLLAATTPFLPWAFRSTEPLALAAGAAFGFAWILIGAGRLTIRPPKELYPVYAG